MSALARLGITMKLYDMGITIVLGMAIVGYVIIHLCGK